MKKAMIFGAMLLGGLLTAQEKGINLNDVQVWKNSLKAESEGILAAEKPRCSRATVIIPVNETSEYRFSVEYKKAPGAPTALFLAGFTLYDKDKKEIMTRHVRAIPGTDTVLVTEAKAGDTAVTIKNGARWKAQRGFYIAFNAPKVPNHDLSSCITGVKREGKVWKATLEKPLEKSYPADTKIRIQADGAHFTFAGKVPGENWEKFQFSVKGVSKDRAENKLFWPGTAYLSPMFLVNWNWGHPESKKLKTLLKNIQLDVVPQK